ncbi:MAG: histidine kinase dimerization/phosphoacceptor domain -containing protein [Pseudomonadota bacterium]
MISIPSLSPQRIFRRLPLFGGRPLVAVPAALAITLAAMLLRVALDPHLPSGFPYVTFFPAVVVSAMLFGLYGGIASSVLGFVLARWFWVAPFGSLSLIGPAGWAMLLYTFVVVVDIVAIHSAQVAFGSLDVERQRNRDLATSRELLFHELQHRVGNNLQMVGSLLALQGRRMTDATAREAVDQASRRVNLVGKIQRTLYNAEGNQRSIREVLGPLVEDIVATSHGGALTIVLDAPRDYLIPAQQAIPLALIVAEAASNALEHGYDHEDAGQITVRVIAEDAGGSLRIEVMDDGRGLPAGFDPASSPSLGLRIARTLAVGLGGQFEVAPAAAGARGTVSILRFPLPEGSREIT